jgi:hypothetical protein
MVIHCSSRLGLVDHLYQKRHQIAYSFGLIAEIPIAMCSGEYDFGKGLVIQIADDEKSTAPSHLTVANEINLFVVTEFIVLSNHLSFEIDQSVSNYCFPNYHSPHSDIFRPPAA